MNTDQRRAMKLLKERGTFDEGLWKAFLERGIEGTPLGLANLYDHFTGWGGKRGQLTEKDLFCCDKCPEKEYVKP